jgi:membrane-associated phospholipid phosphatase
MLRNPASPLGLLAAFVATFVLACSDGPTEPRPATAAPYTASEWAADPAPLASLRWNRLARDLVSAHRTDPPYASRIYALLSVAQSDGIASAHGSIREQFAVVGASMAVLLHFYPDAAALLEEAAAEERAARRGADALDEHIAAGEALGRDAAHAVLEQASTDGENQAWTGVIPTGPGMWFSSTVPPAPPLRPDWGAVRPWLMSAGDQFRPPAPPAFGSPEFADALAEVRLISDTRTAEQLEIARFWADGAGTPTPPGHWNEIASEVIARHGLSERRAVAVLSLMNMAVMDAGISCWDAKFVYWLVRPSQADPMITLPVGLPNFPAYTSGHSSFSGAASEVLSYFFPSERATLRAMAEEAAISRLYGGIHYRFDSERGLEQGRAVALLAISRAEEVRARHGVAH